MSRPFPITLCVVLTTLSLHSQTPWQWRNPQPQGNGFYGVSFHSSDTGIAVGSFGAIVRSVDAGRTWANRPYVTVRQLWDVSMRDGRIGIAVGDSATVLRTSDGGLQWSHIYTGERVNFRVVRFVGRDTVYIAGDSGRVLRSINAGATWQGLGTGVVGTLHGLSFLNAKVGMAVGLGGTVIRTDNAGVTWSKCTNLPAHAKLFGAFFRDAQTLIVCGDSMRIHRSSNAGINWQNVSAPNGDVRMTLYRPAFFGSDTGFIAGQVASVRTYDGGRTWDAVGNSYNRTFRGISTIGDSCVLYTGETPNSFERSSNRGSTWKKLFNDPIPQWQDGCFLGPEVVFATTTGAAYYRSMDGGRSWQAQTLWNRAGINAVHFSDSLRGLLACDRGVIMRSSDGGYIWTRVDSGRAGDLKGVAFASPTVAIAVADSIALRSTDAGITWSVIPLPGCHGPTRVYFVTAQTGFIIGSQGIYRTSDAGTQWSLVFQNSDPLDPLEGIRFVSPSHGYCVGDENQIVKTTNGGVTWRDCSPSGTRREFYDVYFENVFNGIAVGRRIPGEFDFSGILRTTDGGANWFDELPYAEYPLERILFRNPSYGLILGGSGTVLFTTTGVTPVNLESFTADLVEDRVSLRWTTAGETANNGFEIQRREGGKSYQTIGFVKGYGTTNERHDYSFMDRFVRPGEYWYRLRQIDFDGTTEYSPEIHVLIDSPDGFALESVYPNPGNGMAGIRMTCSKATTNGSIVLFDVMGRLVERIETGMLRAGSQTFSVDWSGFPAGMYRLAVYAGNNVRSATIVIR